MTSHHITKILNNAGVSPTPVRILVYKCLCEAKFPISLTDIETALESVDKSTVSRTLATFKKHHLVHAFNDGSGSVKYEPSADSSLHGNPQSDPHVHFRCIKCGITSCLNDLKVPRVELPVGFQALEINYIVTGVCGNCSKKC